MEEQEAMPVCICLSKGNACGGPGKAFCREDCEVCFPASRVYPTIETFLRMCTLHNPEAWEMVRLALEFHQSWPVLVERQPPQFKMTPEFQVDSYLIEMKQEIAWTTQEEYVRRFGSNPPTAPLLLKWANLFKDHSDFNPDWEI